MKLLLPRALVFVAAAALLAGGAPARADASAASVNRLMQAMQVQRQLETIRSQALPAMQRAMQQALQRQGATDDARRTIDALLPRLSVLVREEFSWERLEPAFATIYAETFTQEEVDGLTTFYRTDLGKALVAKTPQLALRSTPMMMQQRIGPLMERMMQIARDESTRARSDGATPASGARR